MSSPNPYEPPAIPERESLPARATARDEEYDTPPFRSPRLPGVICILLFGLVILHTAMEVHAQVTLYQLQNESISEEELDNQAIAAWHSWAGLIAAADWPLLIVAHLWLISWTYRCHRNLESLGHRKLDSKHIWAVLCWFIPVLNLFCPFQVMREIWWRSHPLSQASADTAPAAHLVFWWWLLRLTTVATAWLTHLFVLYETWPQYYTYLRTFLLSGGCEIITAVLAIIIVHRISQWQIARYQMLQESSAASS